MNIRECWKNVCEGGDRVAVECGHRGELVEGGRMQVTVWQQSQRRMNNTSFELVFLSVEAASPVPCLITPISVILGSLKSSRGGDGGVKRLSSGQGPCPLLGPVSH